MYRLAPDGSADILRPASDWHGMHRESEAFYLRTLAPGDFRYKGADLGALVTRGRLQTDDTRLERRCTDWIGGIRGMFSGTPVVPLQSPAPVRESFKLA